MLSSSI